MKNEEQRLPPVRERRRWNGLSVSIAAFVSSGCLLLAVAGALLVAGPPVHFSSSHAGRSTRFVITPSVSTHTVIAFTTSTSTEQSTIDNGSLNWPVGTCTYWANARYHKLSGYWVSWSGNPAQWVAGARAAGWHVSSQPHLPAILILMPGVQNAGTDGHAAVVENILSLASSTVVRASNMQWYTNGGGWNIVSYADFKVGAGVYFIWR